MGIFVKDENNIRTTPLKIKPIEEEYWGDLSEPLIAELPVSGFYDGDAVVLNGETYILGGRTLGHCYKYSGGEWVDCGWLPTSMKYAKAVVLNGEIHVFGGTDQDTLKYRCHHKYSNGRWIQDVSTLPHNFYGGCAVVFNDEIHILGGGTTDEMMTTHHKYSNGQWVPVSTLPYSFYGGCAVVFNNEINILGGAYYSNSYYNGSKHFKYAAGQWTRVSTIINGDSEQESCVFSSAVVLNNAIHILGGHNNLTHLQYFNGEWTEPMYASLGEELFHGAAIVLNDEEIHVVNADGYYIAEKITYQSLLWESKSQIPKSFASGCAVVLNNMVHLLGSSLNAGSPQREHCVYQPSTDSWAETSPPVPYDFYYGCAVVLNNEIHILGGGLGSNRSNHYKLSDLGTNPRWDPVSTLPQSFEYGCAVVLNNEIHILGGGDSNLNSDRHYKYSNGEWVRVSTLPYQFTYGCAVVLNGEIHILGGGDRNNEDLWKHYKYSNGEWVRISSLPWGEFMPKGAYKSCAVVLNNEIHLLGGISDERQGSIEHWKLSNDEWLRISELPYGFESGAAVVLGNKIYIFGCEYSENSRKTHVTDTTLCSYLYNKIKNIWAKVKVPVFDQYGNCHIEEQAKRVKAVWVGGSDNKAKRIYF